MDYHYSVTEKRQWDGNTIMQHAAELPAILLLIIASRPHPRKGTGWERGWGAVDIRWSLGGGLKEGHITSSA